MRNTEVVVVGAGPVGTVAAYALAEADVNVVLCEQSVDRARDLRASTIHPPTLEMLDELGVAPQIVDYGLQAPVFHFRERRSGETAAFDMTELAEDTEFPFRIQCEQHVMAGMLLDRLEAHPQATVLYGHRARHCEQGDDDVVTQFDTPQGRTGIRSRYVIAADGSNSAIRRHLGVDFAGFTYAEKFLCLSTGLDLREHIERLCYVNYLADPEEWIVLLRAPSAWRVLVAAGEDRADAELLSDATRDRIFFGLIGRANVPTIHRTIYRVHQRVVEKFNHGRILLAGDSAHLNNPLGGFGMNSGIHDVWNLKDRLVHCLRHGHDEAQLDLYDRQRRAVTMSFIQAQTIQNKELLEHGAEEGHARRFARMMAISEDPVRRREFLLRQSMISSLYDASEVD